MNLSGELSLEQQRIILLSTIFAIRKKDEGEDKVKRNLFKKVKFAVS